MPEGSTETDDEGLDEDEQEEPCTKPQNLLRQPVENLPNDP